MRIDGPKDIGKASKSSKGKASASGAKFVVHTGRQSTGLSGTAAPQAINDVGALFAAQGVDERQTEREVAIKHGTHILDSLDDLKVGLLSGRVSPHLIHSLRTKVAEKGRFQADDRLQPLLQQIELRAEVELAKLAKQKLKSA